MRRVAKRQVILLFEPLESLKFWLLEYFLECLALPLETGAPGVDDVRVHLNVHTVAPVPIPAGCTDGFAVAYWRRFERLSGASGPGEYIQFGLAIAGRRR